MDQHSPIERFIGKSKAAQEAREFAKKAAKSDLTILLRGESGVGKDFLAELIHQAGNNERPFVVVDCGALTESLSETELFGHIKGAFTDANQKKIGLVRMAENGTIFFNEMANMSLVLQAKFLRILDKRPFRAVGGRTEYQVRARIIAATNANLEEAVRTQKFRLDLFHRLNVIPFSILPLRERKEDIPELVSFFSDRKLDQFSSDALKIMMEYHWSGNVRELINLIQRAIFMNEREQIGPEQIERYLTTNPAATNPAATNPADSLLVTFTELEKEYLCDVLRASKDSRAMMTKAEAISGIGKRALNYKIKKFGLEDFVDRLRKGLID